MNINLDKNDLVFVFLIFFLALFLRLIFQNRFPPGFSPDEGAFAYDAWSILQTGRDQYGNFFPVVFKSFGDYKAPLYVYFTAVSEFIFGLNKLAVRMPSIFFGSLMTVFVYFLVRSFSFNKNKKLFAVVSGLLLATSPWHLLESRFTSECVLAGFFILAGILFFFKWLNNQKGRLILLSAVFFVLSAYSYHSARLTGFLLLTILSLLYWKNIQNNFKQALMAFFFGLLLIFPLLINLVGRSEEMMRRPMAISIFNDEGLKNKLWLLTHVASVSPPPPILNRFFNNKPLFYLSDFTKRWLQHFNLDYLFINGDPYDRFQTPRAGLISLFALPFFIWGLKIIMQRIIQKRSNRSIIGKSNKEGIFILGWLGISPIVSSLAVFTPNSLHTFDAVVPFQIITAAGLTVFLLKIKNSLRRGLILAFAILVFLLPFFYSYTQTVPHHSQYASFWHYGFEELMEEVKNSERDYHKIFFLGNANFDLVAFFQKYPPVKFQEEVVYKSASDKKFYDRIESFGKYYFLEKAEELKNIPSNSLIILGGEYGQKIKLIKNNTVAVVLWAPPNQEVSFKVRKIFYYRDGRISYILTQS